MLEMSEIVDGGFPPDSHCMVRVTNAWKSYNRTDNVLQNLSMSVYRGQIYSLVGSSGVGKTTLLSCITSNNMLDSGQIEVDIDSRLRIGYMPQELALYEELTLNETFQFFGLIQFMTKKEIASRLKELQALLELPHQDAQLSSLSGGQQRRVSVAVTMMKNPDLLILDEPTVSLDPLLKQSIWIYLIKISKEEGKTILMTTHYVEEAKNSDRIGFMAKGRILMEGTPAEALRITNPPSERLEDIYHKLCYEEMECNDIIEPPKSIKPATNSFSKKSSFSMRRVMALNIKCLFFIRRNLMLFYSFIFSPTIFLVILTIALAKPKGLKLGYVNYEDLCIVTSMNCSSPLSCRYLKKLTDNHFDLVRFESTEEGKAAIERNHVWALVKFNSNFSDGVTNRLDYFYASEHVEVSDEDEAKVWLDMSAYPIAHLIKKDFYDSFLESIEDWYADCGWNTKAAHPIFRIEEYIYGQADDSLISSAIPTVIVILMYSTGLALGLIFVLGDREFGTFDRCRVAGLLKSELLVSAFLTSFFSLIPTGIALLLMLYLYSGPANAPVVWTVILLYLQIATGVLQGSLLGLLTDSIAKAMQLTMGAILTFTYLSGMIWPIESAHWIAKFIYNSLPAYLSAGAIRAMATKGLDLRELYWGLADSFIWLTISLTVLFFIVKKCDN